MANIKNKYPNFKLEDEQKNNLEKYYNLETIKLNLNDAYNSLLNCYNYFTTLEFDEVLKSLIQNDFMNSVEASLHTYYAKKIFDGELSTQNAVNYVISDMLKNVSSLKTNNYTLKSVNPTKENIKNELDNSRPVIAYIKTGDNTAHAIVIYDYDQDEDCYLAHFGYKEQTCVEVTVNDVYYAISFEPKFAKEKSNNYIVKDILGERTFSGCEYDHIYDFLSTNRIYDIFRCKLCFSEKIHEHMLDKKN